MNGEKNSSVIKNNLFLFSIIGILLALLIRNSGLYIFFGWDEIIYSRSSRLFPLAQSPIPSYIYLAIYRLTNFLGDGFHQGAKILNAIFFVAATPFIYSTARRTCTKDLACIVAVLTLLGPINSYTAYFMPESLYFFSFWLLTWFILGLDYTADFRSWGIAGLLLGFCSLVKPHALFLIPGIFIYMFLLSRKKEAGRIMVGFKNIVSFFALTFTTKLLIGYLVAGKAGLTFFGPTYNSIASSVSKSSHFLDFLNLFFFYFKGHLLSICLLYGLPFTCLLYLVINWIFSKKEIDDHGKITFYTLLVLTSLLVVVAAFTASITNTDPTQTLGRLHMRYYNFALPLLLIIVASQTGLESISTVRKWRIFASFPIGALILYSIYLQLQPYTPNIIDSPELIALTFKLKLFYILSGISFISIIFWTRSTKAGAKFYIFLFMPLLIGISILFTSNRFSQNFLPDVYDNAGIITKKILKTEELSKLLVVGSEQGGLYKTVFYLDNPKTYFEVISPGSAYDLSKIPQDKDWVLVIGDHKLPKKTSYLLRVDGFVLARKN